MTVSATRTKTLLAAMRSLSTSFAKDRSAIQLVYPVRFYRDRLATFGANMSPVTLASV